VGAELVVSKLREFLLRLELVGTHTAAAVEEMPVAVVAVLVVLILVVVAAAAL
jgi:hypothetical protein